MVSPPASRCAVVDPIPGPPKPKSLVRDSRRISCNPTRTQIVAAPALAHDPVYGPKAHTGFNTPFQRGAPPFPRLSVALSELKTNNMQIVVFFPHSPVFLFPSNSNLISLSFDLQLFSPFRNLYSGILKAQTPAPFEVALRPPRLVPWGHYSQFFSSHASRPLMSWLLGSCIGGHAGEGYSAGRHGGVFWVAPAVTEVSMMLLRI